MAEAKTKDSLHGKHIIESLTQAGLLKLVLPQSFFGKKSIFNIFGSSLAESAKESSTAAAKPANLSKLNNP